MVNPCENRNYTLPTLGEVITWQEFFGTMVAAAYREADSTKFKMLQQNSSVQLEALGEEAARAVEAKHEVKLARLSKQIAEAELQQEEATADKVKEALQKQIEAQAKKHGGKDYEQLAAEAQKSRSIVEAADKDMANVREMGEKEEKALSARSRFVTKEAK